MAKVAALSCMIASASAFMGAPVAVPKSVAPRVSMMAEMSPSVPFMKYPEQLKGLPASVGFDPLGLSEWVPVEFMQEAEIKHGRICMLAVAGWIVADIVKLPGDVHMVSSLEAHDAAVKYGAMQQILLWTSAFEALSVPAVVQMLQGSGRKPGYFGFDPLGMAKTDAAMEVMQVKEIKNGRLAMLAFSGIVTVSAMGSSTFPYLP